MEQNLIYSKYDKFCINSFIILIFYGIFGLITALLIENNISLLFAFIVYMSIYSYYMVLYNDEMKLNSKYGTFL